MKTSIMMVLCVACVVANAATVNLKGSSSDGFTKASTWDSGKPPESGNDYVVANGYYLHGDYSEGFAGDSLQFGIVGGTEGIFFKEHAGTHTFTKLILANGYYRTWMSDNGQSGHIAGAVEVTSPESAPFRLHSTHNSGAAWCYTYWDATITGAQGTVLKVGPYLLNNAHLSKGQTIFTGDNSGYLGSIEAYGTNAVFAFTTGNSLGGALPSFKADALSLSDGTTFECQGSDVTLAASLNRGIYVNETGGRIKITSGKSLRVEWPISGEGRLSKVGAGTLTLAGPMSLSVADPAADTFVVSNGCVVFASGFSNSAGGGISVLPGCEVMVPAGDEIEVCNLALSGAIRIAYDDGLATNGVLVLGAGSALNGPIPVYPPNVRGVKMPFLKVPTSVQTVTAADFTKPDDLPATGLPSVKFTVETAGGVQTVYATMSTLVTVSASSAHSYIYPWGSDREKWSDSSPMHSGADYLIGPGKKLDSTGLTGDYTILGDSITFEGSSSSTASFDSMGVASGNLTSLTGDIRTKNYVKFYPTTADGGVWHLCGRLHVGGYHESDHCLDFRAAKSMTLTIDSVVSGSGGMCFQPQSNYQTNTYFFTSSSNTFNGTFFVYGAKTETLTTLKFANAGSWGKDSPSFREGMTLQGQCGLYPVGSQTVNLPNRRIQFYDGSHKEVLVDEGEVFELNSESQFYNGKTVATRVEKIGGGTWAIGGVVSTERNGLTEFPHVDVNEGYLRADRPRAFVNINVTVAEGAGIAAKYRPGATSEVATYGMIVTNATRFAVSGDTLKFKVMTDGEKVRASEKVAILTVPEETATAIDAKAIRIEHDDAYGRYPVLERDAVTVSGFPCIRYSCRFIKGTTFILR